MYNNNRQYGFGRSNGGFSKAPYSQQYQNQQFQKKSGAGMGQYTNKKGERIPYVNGWKKSKEGFITIMCNPYKDTEKHQSKKSGLTYENWIAEIKVGANRPYILPVLYRVDTCKIIIDQLSMVINPKALNGGYCGTFIKSKRR